MGGGNSSLSNLRSGSLRSHPVPLRPFAFQDQDSCSPPPHRATLPSRHHAPPVEAPDPGGSRRRAAPRRGGPLLPRGRGPPPPPLRPPRGRLRGRSVPQASLPSSPRCRAFLITYRPPRLDPCRGGRIGARSGARSGWAAGPFNGVACSRAPGAPCANSGAYLVPFSWCIRSIIIMWC